MPVASCTSYTDTDRPGLYRLGNSLQSSELGTGEVQVRREEEGSAQRWEAQGEGGERGRGYTHLNRFIKRTWNYRMTVYVRFLAVLEFIKME